MTAPFFMRSDGLATDYLRRTATRHQHRADTKSASITASSIHHGVRGAGHNHASPVDSVQGFKPLSIEIEDGDLGAASDGHLSRVSAHGTRAKNDDLAARNAGNSSEQHPATAVRPLQIVRADLDGTAGRPPRSSA